MSTILCMQLLYTNLIIIWIPKKYPAPKQLPNSHPLKFSITLQIHETYKTLCKVLSIRFHPSLIFPDIGKIMFRSDYISTQIQPPGTEQICKVFNIGEKSDGGKSSVWKVLAGKRSGEKDTGWEIS